MFVHLHDANRAVDEAFGIASEREVRDVHRVAAEQELPTSPMTPG